MDFEGLLMCSSLVAVRLIGMMKIPARGYPLISQATRQLNA